MPRGRAGTVPAPPAGRVFPFRFGGQAEAEARQQAVQFGQEFIVDIVPGHRFHRAVVALEKRGVFALHDGFPEGLGDRVFADKKMREGDVVRGFFVVVGAGGVFVRAHAERAAVDEDHVQRNDPGAVGRRQVQAEIVHFAPWGHGREMVFAGKCTARRVNIVYARFGEACSPLKTTGQCNNSARY